MAKKIDIKNGDVVLSEAMGILHQRVRNLSKLQYSFCCSPSGCLLSRVAVNPQGAAIGENLLRHFVPFSIVKLFSGGQGLQGSGRYFQRHRRKIRHPVSSGDATQSLKGSDRYSLRYHRRIALTASSSLSLKGSDRYSPVA